MQAFPDRIILRKLHINTYQIARCTGVLPMVPYIHINTYRIARCTGVLPTVNFEDSPRTRHSSLLSCLPRSPPCRK